MSGIWKHEEDTGSAGSVTPLVGKAAACLGCVSQPAKDKRAAALDNSSTASSAQPSPPAIAASGEYLSRERASSRVCREYKPALTGEEEAEVSMEKAAGRGPAGDKGQGREHSQEPV